LGSRFLLLLGLLLCILGILWLSILAILCTLLAAAPLSAFVHHLLKLLAKPLSERAALILKESFEFGLDSLRGSAGLQHHRYVLHQDPKLTIAADHGLQLLRHSLRQAGLLLGSQLFIELRQLWLLLRLFSH